MHESISLNYKKKGEGQPRSCTKNKGLFNCHIDIIAIKARKNIKQEAQEENEMQQDLFPCAVLVLRLFIVPYGFHDSNVNWLPGFMIIK